MDAREVENAKPECATRQDNAKALAGKCELLANGWTGIFIEIAIDVACEHWLFPVMPIFFSCDRIAGILAA
jgi:hypothetical protein